VSTLSKRIEAMEGKLEQLRRFASPGRQSTTFDEWLDAVSPRYSWDAPHLVYMREHLDRVTAGTIRKLMIFTAPRHGKSALVTIRYPAWLLECWPHKRVVVGSYNATLAESFSRATRRICGSRMLLSDERTAVNDWETAAGGGLRAVGVGGGVTGRGADLIIIDDPVKSREEANSQAYRERVWDWYRDDLYTRQEPGAAMVLILTRWHLDDLAGRILASVDGQQWTIVTLPALAERNDPLGRAEGQALWPERYDESELGRIRATLGSSFEALYQQRPTALEGAIFKREWWRHFREQPKFSRIVQSWDTAFKAGQDNDYSVCTTWGEADNGYYLLDVWRRRVEFPALKAMVVKLGDEFNASVVLVEDKASGQSLLQELQRDTKLPIRPVKVDSDKVSRAYAATPIIETGRVFLPESAPWLAVFVNELASFPAALHDDVVDSTTQALNYMVATKAPPPADYSRGPGIRSHREYVTPFDFSRIPPAV
jgi:predicted phage terminase large subunit-like protein